MSELSPMQQCVMAESVYNALVLLQAMTVQELCQQLSVRWTPAWASAEETISAENVEQALEALLKLEVVQQDGGRFSAISRKTLVVSDYENERLKKVMVK